MNVIEEVMDFYGSFDGEKGYIGKTENGEDIPYMFVGDKKGPVILAQYCIHAREYVTAYLALEQIKYLKKRKIQGGVYFIPIVNIDGVRIVLDGNPYYKANARGVDLNVNFNARWGTGKLNALTKGDANYIGEYPFSESETRALKDFTYIVKPNMTLSYHSKGEEIYWQFYQGGEAFLRDKRLALKVAKSTGYKVKPTPYSAGGYKDWCIESLKIPALTIEVGKEKLKHPLGKKDLKQIKRKNLKTIPLLIKELKNG